MPVNRLVNANQSVRCRHVKVNGLSCGAPARRGRNYCCFHDSAVRRNREFVLPIIEDAASLQLALNKILQALVDKLIDQKTAGALLYGLQIAQANLNKLQGERRLDDHERKLEAARNQQQRAAAQHSATARLAHEGHPDDAERSAAQAPRFSPIDYRQPAIGNAAPARPITRSPARPDSGPIRDFLHELTKSKMADDKSQVASDTDRQNTRSPDPSMKFDFNACAGDDLSSLIVTHASQSRTRDL